MPRRLALACLCAAQAACGAHVAGVVFVDHNRDGARQDGEPAVAGAVVALDHGVAVTRTDRSGAFSLDAPGGAGIVWVRVPAGYRPGPVWRAAGGTADLPLVPLTAEEDAAPVSFVVAADTHAPSGGPEDPWTGGDLADGIAQAIALADPPRFFTIVGDVTQANRPEEFQRVEDALRDVAVPWIPVAGNHDWYDGGRAWRARWGPDSYSFDVRDVHVIVWDTNLDEDQQLAFFRADLAHVAPGMIVVALGHGSPSDAIADELAAIGVDYLFTGHWHANRRVDRAGLVEWGTQTLMMGTIDQSPAGYRIVTFVEGVPHVEHRARLVEPHLAIAAPHAGSCTPAAPLDVLVSAALDAGTPVVTARVDCGAPIALASRGGWSFGARIPALPAGAHSLTVTAEAPSGRRQTRQIAFEVCAPAVAPGAAADWPQLGGGPDHANAQAQPIVPPLQQAWATSVGGNVALGTPVVAGGIVVVAVWDLGAGDGGGLVALELATGAVRWRATTPFQARNAPAIAGDTVVVALGNGEVHAFGLADGAPRWTHDAAEGLDSLASQLWAAPAIANGIVYIAVQGRMSALDLATGEAVWARDRAPEFPWLGSLAAVTVADGTALANYARQEGMTAWAAATGARQWELRGAKAVAINATPIAKDGTVYVVSSAGLVSAIGLTGAAPVWSVSVTPEASDWDYSVTATPALAGGRLFVPTQYGELIALDAASGVELWRYATPGGPLQFAHYRADTPGFAASSVVTGDLVWVPRPDGVLAAVSAADGTEVWSTALGAPIVSAPAPVGSALVVATFDGTVRALVPAAAATALPPPAPCEPPGEAPPDATGCCGAGADPRSAVALAAGVLAWLVVPRRRRARATS